MDASEQMDIDKGLITNKGGLLFGIIYYTVLYGIFPQSRITEGKLFVLLWLQYLCSFVQLVLLLLS